MWGLRKELSGAPSKPPRILTRNLGLQGVVETGGTIARPSTALQ